MEAQTRWNMGEEMSKLSVAIKVAGVLQEAKKIVAKRWSQGAYFKDLTGEILASTSDDWLGIPTDDRDDYDYCGDGALRRAVKNQMAQWNEEDQKRSRVESVLYEAEKALTKPILRRIPESDLRWNGTLTKRANERVWCFNDMESTTHDSIMEVFDEAIAEQCELVCELSGGRPPEPSSSKEKQAESRPSPVESPPST